MKPSYQTHLDSKKERDLPPSNRNPSVIRFRPPYSLPSPSTSPFLARDYPSPIPAHSLPIRPSITSSDTMVTSSRGRGRGFAPSTRGQIRRLGVGIHPPSVRPPVTSHPTSNPLPRAQPRSDVWQPAPLRPLPILQTSEDTTIVTEGEAQESTEAALDADANSSRPYPSNRVHFALPPRPPTSIHTTIQRQLPDFSFQNTTPPGSAPHGRGRGRGRGRGYNHLATTYNPNSSDPKFNHYHTLKSQNGFTLTFRVHSSSSYTQLKWTGEADTSGFSAPAPAFKHLTPKSYEIAYGGKGSDGGWMNKSWYRQLMIDHILQRPTRPFPSLPPFYDGPIRPSIVTQPTHTGSRNQLKLTSASEPSCWISTTRSIDWAIFCIAHQLAHLPPDQRGIVKLAVVKVDNASSTSTNGSGDGEGRELTIIPWYPLSAHEDDIISPHKREFAIRARIMTGNSFETLFWGRVFSRNIQEDLIWTREEIPFHLPSKFWERSFTSTHSQLQSQSWLNKLCWDPFKDNWSAALRKMKEPNNWFWNEQPVHQYCSVWPPVNSDTYRIPDTVPAIKNKSGKGGFDTIIKTKDESLVSAFEDLLA